MKYLITGYKGQLGYDIKRELLSRGIDDENIMADKYRNTNIKIVKIKKTKQLKKKRI